MEKKKIYIIGGVILVAGVAYYMYTKNKKKKKEEEDTKKRIAAEAEAAALLEAQIDLEEVEQEKEKESCIRIGELRTTENHQWIGIPYSSRDQANEIGKGDTVEIKNTEEGFNGEYEVLDTWKDKNGNIGALDISHKLELPKVPKGDKGDERFIGKGLICIK